MKSFGKGIRSRACQGWNGKESDTENPEREKRCGEFSREWGESFGGLTGCLDVCDPVGMKR